MPLQLTITGYQALFPGQEMTKSVERGAITLGRGPQNDWVLQDPERILSGRHCIIQYQDGRCFVTDTSTNGVFRNHAEQRLERDEAVELHDGDYLIMGEYEIAVKITAWEAETDEPAEAVTDVIIRSGFITDEAAVEPLPASPPRQDFPAPTPPTRLPRVFAGPLFDEEFPPEQLTPEDSGLLELDWAKPAALQQVPEPDHLAPERAFFQPPPTAPGEPPAGAEAALAQPDAAVVMAEQASPAAAPGSTQEEPVIPEDWWDTEDIELRSEEPLPAQPIAAAQPAAAGMPFAEITERPLPETKGTPLLEERPLFEAQPVAGAVHSELSRPAAVALPGENARAAWQAFLKGAGLPPLPISEEQLPEVMVHLGEMFRQMVQGMMEILTARGNLKGEFRIEKTQLGPNENNPLKFTDPLKFADSVTNAMTRLLKQQPGFMAPVQAVRGGFTDIKAHELAVMAGIQAALTQLLARFDPTTLEGRLGGHSMLENMLPGKRKAKYWDSFKALYAALVKEAEDDFSELFGKEFARAY